MEMVVVFIWRAGGAARKRGQKPNEDVASVRGT